MSEVTLTDAERASITRCIEEHGGVCREVMCDESLDETVRKILAARLAEVTAERGLWYDRAGDALAALRKAEAENARLRDTLAGGDS